MAKHHKIKRSTVEQLEKLIQEHGVSGMMDTTEYQNMCARNYLNKLEKENLKTIIALINDGKSYDEIRFIVEGGEYIEKQGESSDPVDEATREFMISMATVVESEPVEVVIAGVDDVKEDEPEEVERVEVEKTEANDNTVQEESEPDNVILLKDIIDEKKNESKKVEENESLPKWDPPKYTKRKKQYPTVKLPEISIYTEGLRKFH